MKSICLKGSVKGVAYNLRIYTLVNGGGQISQSSFTTRELSQTGVFKVAGNVNEVTFFLRHCASWFSEIAIVDVSPGELMEFKEKTVRATRREGHKKW